MALPSLPRAANLTVNKENGFLIFMLISLVVSEDYIGKDFNCPCKSNFRKKIFFSYLLVPAFVVFAVMYCIMTELQTSKKGYQQQESNEETQVLESNRGAQISGRPNECSFKKILPGKWRQLIFTFWCFIPSFFWMILFFCDGRYWACYLTTYEGDADSTALPPWEWCNRNRTMTAAQKIAERAYNDSKFGGFVALFVSTLVILLLYIIYKYCQERGVSSEQTAAEQGTTGAQESSGQRTPTHMRTPHDNCQDTARTQERSGQQTSTCVNTEAEGLPMVKLPATEEN
ncbi:uncharacterized protein LOC108414770 isoform X1 [Pygocentrus nattereri]|uniref:uncharacterized protein LOC108414770 isoform X1 n=1 Tax=Pygocentrus nattereri TaxID=42514 RepID=UPI0008148761|nr:uncharacterized protein LOC108414770 isoform X1 [Pygocentrus nattereri]